MEGRKTHQNPSSAGVILLACPPACPSKCHDSDTTALNINSGLWCSGLRFSHAESSSASLPKRNERCANLAALIRTWQLQLCSRSNRRVREGLPILTSKMVSNWRRLVVVGTRDRGRGLVRISAKSLLA